MYLEEDWPIISEEDWGFIDGEDQGLDYLGLKLGEFTGP